MKRANSCRLDDNWGGKKRRLLEKKFKPRGGIQQWHQGELCPIKMEKAWFIKPYNDLPNGYDKTKDVFMHPSSISKYMLSLQEKDVLDFILGDRDKTKPMACRIRVSSFSSRTQTQVVDYLKKLVDHLKSAHVKQVLQQILPCDALWTFLGSPTFKSVEGK